MIRLALLGLAAPLLAACGPSREAAERTAIVAKIDALRRIPAEDTSARARAATELRGLPAEAPRAVDARDTCAKAFATLAEAMRLTASAESGLASPTADAKETLRAAGEANRMLDEAEPLLDRCADAAAALQLEEAGGAR